MDGAQIENLEGNKVFRKFLEKTWETFKQHCILVRNKGRCKLVGGGAEGSCDDEFATPFASLWTTVPWLED